VPPDALGAYWTMVHISDAEARTCFDSAGVNAKVAGRRAYFERTIFLRCPPALMRRLD